MIFGSTDVLSPIQLKKLSEHKYSSTGCTLLDPLMQPFWNWLVKKFPLWLAPNAMTIAGLLINIFTSLLLIYYSPDGVQEAPRWAFLLCAFGLFAYQTLDACDGKQARRTGTSSPLGELFDHGCDSLSTVFVALGVCISVQLGRYPSWMFFQCFAAIILFYSAHWQTYVSGMLRFGKFDVTEAQFTVMFIHIISALFGPSIWSIKITTTPCIELKFVPVFMGLMAASVALYSNFYIIFTGGAGKNGTSTAGTSILSPLVPMGLVVLSAFVIYQKSTYTIYENHPCLYILAFGVVSAKVTNRLVVVHMTKSEVDYLDSIFIGPGMLFMNQYFNTFFSEYIVLWICLTYSAADFLYYCASVCRQICSHLHIHMFTIIPSTPQSELDISNSSMDSTPLISTLSNDETSETSVVSLDEP